MLVFLRFSLEKSEIMNEQGKNKKIDLLACHSTGELCHIQCIGEGRES